MEELKFEKSIDIKVLNSMIRMDTTLGSLIEEYPKVEPIELQKAIDRLEKQNYIQNRLYEYTNQLPVFRINIRTANILTTLKKLYPSFKEFLDKGDHLGVMQISENYKND